MYLHEYLVTIPEGLEVFILSPEDLGFRVILAILLSIPLHFAPPGRDFYCVDTKQSCMTFVIPKQGLWYLRSCKIVNNNPLNP